VSAILAEALQASYWKPVQAGDLDQSDRLKVVELAPSTAVLSERFCLNTPASPHFSAELDGITMKELDFDLPIIDGNLIVEGAGGLMVPLNNNGLLYIDLFEKWKLPVVLVSRHYLGSINHTLLSVEALISRNIPIKGIIFVGEENAATEKIISTITDLEVLIRIPEVESIDRAFIQVQADKIRQAFL
jgi:dethiobiotin synthetase